jgi:hypothetical protein
MFPTLKAVPLHKDWAQPNRELNLAVEELKGMFPSMFWQPHELKHRRFFHEPKTWVPHESYVVSHTLNTR